MGFVAAQLNFSSLMIALGVWYRISWIAKPHTIWRNLLEMNHAKELIWRDQTLLSDTNGLGF